MTHEPAPHGIPPDPWDDFRAHTQARLALGRAGAALPTAELLRFGLTHAQSFDIMLTVHKKGLAVVGVFSFEVAETKVAQVMDFARRHQHPLQCTMEKE